MQNAKSFTGSKRRDRPRSVSPSRGKPPDPSGDRASLGKAYLETFNAPALASTSEVYMEVYATVRAILQRFHWRHAPTAVKAAWDAAASHVTRSLVMGGGQGDE